MAISEVEIRSKHSRYGLMRTGVMKLDEAGRGWTKLDEAGEAKRIFFVPEIFHKPLSSAQEGIGQNNH